jgi:hypothetical protein
MFFYFKNLEDPDFSFINKLEKLFLWDCCLLTKELNELDLFPFLNY